MTRWRSLCAGWLLGIAAAAAGAEESPTDAVPDGGLRFLRVHVPHGKIGEVDLGGERYVPMSADEFAAAVGRLTGRDRSAVGPAGLGGLADTARYVAGLAGDPRDELAAGRLLLTGTASWTLRELATSRSIAVGGLQVGRASMRTAAGTGEALVFGAADGGLAIATPEPGEYECEWQCPAMVGVDGGWVFRLPLVPALSTAIELRLPAGLRPLVADATVLPAAATEAAATTWRIDVGPRREITIAIRPASDEASAPPRLRVWHDVSVRGREARLAALVEPVAEWPSRQATQSAADGIRIRLAVPRDTIIAAIRVRDADTGAETPADWTRPATATHAEVIVPARSVGSRDALVVEAVGPMAWGTAGPLPVIGVAAADWAGGGMVVNVDAALAVTSVETSNCAVVPPETAARWPTASLAVRDDDAQPGVLPARLFIEHQEATHAARVALEPRVATVAVNRVTVVDVSPGAVLGKATCELSVARGEAFEVRGRLAKGWVLDTVEAVTPGGSMTESPEWRVGRDGTDDVVRIAFAAAVTPQRRITLRIAGHRAGVPPGVDIASTELDMVRLEGEGTSSMLAVKTGPDMTIDLDGEEPRLAAADAALATLATDSAIRVRLPAGGQAAASTMRLVRRRPPIDARTQVRITSRDGRLTESFTFECMPQRSDIDALVVHFSTVMDDRLEWSLLPPATGTLVARRIDPPDRREGRAGEPIADSWIVELSTPARDTVTVRAAATVPFTGPTPVPLAWIEGATRQAGVVSIREAGRFRPLVLNRRLEELPPAADGGGQAFATVAEFAFDPARGRADDALAAAEIVPGGSGIGDDARAWAWREENTMWCHASGAIEFETRFQLENHGRSSITLSVPETLLVQGVAIDGELVAGGGGGPGGQMTVELPVGERFVEIVVQSLGVCDSRPGIWRVDPRVATLDVPVLQRSSLLLLAPDVAIARVAGAYRVVDDPATGSAGWVERLLGASLRPAEQASEAAAEERAGRDAGLSPSGNVVEGYRPRVLVPVVGQRAGGGVLLVRGAVVQGASILAAAIAFLGILFVPATRGWIVPWACGLAAVGALWAAVPFDAVFRAACWAGMVALVLRSGGLQPVAAVAVVVLAACGPSAAAAEPLRVFITPLEAGAAASETALVPEPLFRALARATVEPAGVRVVACSIAARMPASTEDAAGWAWKLTVDVDADAGGVFVLDQAASGGLVTGSHAILDGGRQPLLLEQDGRAARVAMPNAGRHRLEFSVRPAVSRRGDVEEAVAMVPCAAVGRLTLTAAEDAAAIVCEAASASGVFRPAARLADPPPASLSYDVSRATAVRLLRPADPRLRLAPGPRSVASRNDVFWDLDACRVIATFDIDAGDEVVRSLVVDVDPGLAPTETRPGLRAIGPHRYLVERAAPVRGRWMVQIPFRMPLSAPVGVFTVPGAWVANAAADARTTRLVAAADLTVDVTLPDGMTAALRETEAALPGFAWRADVGGPLAAAAKKKEEWLATPPRLTSRPVVRVERRVARPRAVQQLALDFGPEQVWLGLQARIDATSTALAELTIDLPSESVIDRVELREDDGPQGSGAGRGPVDVRWTRVAPDTLRVVAQRPRSGRFRLEVDARLPGRLPARGALSVMRAALAGSVPMKVEWRTAADRGAVLRAAYGEVFEVDRVPVPASERVSAGVLELAGGETALVYELGDVEPSAPPAVADAATAGLAPAPARDARVEWADVFLDVDGRGRAWGTVRFDVVADAPTVRMALPKGLRLFEVQVDGRAVAAAPQDDGTWLVSLFGTRWPRSVVAVFAGEATAGRIDGAPVAIEPPSLVGLPCRQLAWTLRVAPGLTVGIDAPLRAADAAALAAARQAAAERLEDDFIRAVEESDPAERSRMTDFARLRRSAAALPAEEAWLRATDAAAGQEMVHALVDIPAGDGAWPALPVRVGRAADPTAAARALATLGVLAACAGVWRLAARWPLDRHRSAALALPLGVGFAGVVWLLLLDPVWPAWVFLAAAAALAAWHRRGPRGEDAADESTLTQFAPPAASSWGATTTRTFLTPDA